MSNGGRRMDTPPNQQDMLNWMGRHWQIPVGFFMMVAVMFCALVFGLVKGCEIDGRQRMERAKMFHEQSKEFFNNSR